MKVSLVHFYELPDDVKEDQPNNGYGKEEASYLMVEFSDGRVNYYSDAMEPEDARFERDLHWVMNVIREAHEDGFQWALR